MPERELFILHYITLHYIIYQYGFTLVFCNLHCINNLYRAIKMAVLVALSPSFIRMKFDNKHVLIE